MQAARWAAVVACIMGLAWAEPAQAGRRPFTWSYDTELVPKGDVELEQWLWARGRAPAFPEQPSAYWVWWGPVFGLSQQLELALPFQVRSTRSVTQLESFEADLRYRLFPRGDERAFQPLVRLAWHQAIHTATPSRVDLHLVGSYQREGGLRAVLDLGSQVGIPALRGGGGPVTVLGRYSAGLAYPIIPDELQLSLESVGEFALRGLDHEPRLFIGPNVAWTFGRTWVTVGTLVGVTGLFPETPRFMPRLIWAVIL